VDIARRNRKPYEDCDTEAGSATQAREAVMNERIATEVFSPAEKLFNSACAVELMRCVMQGSVASSRQFYSKAAAAGLEGARAMTELTDTVWSTTKMLNDKIIQNATANAEAAFDTAQALAGARSFAEVATIQSEFVQRFAATAAAQSREFVDLLARTTDHVIETAQAAASRSLKGGF
jgi:hypothetical protein